MRPVFQGRAYYNSLFPVLVFKPRTSWIALDPLPVPHSLFLFVFIWGKGLSSPGWPQGHSVVEDDDLELLILQFQILALRWEAPLLAPIHCVLSVYVLYHGDIFLCLPSPFIITGLNIQILFCNGDIFLQTCVCFLSRFSH